MAATQAAQRLSILSLQMTAVNPSSSSTWEGVAQAPPDPIIGISEAWKSDPSPQKLNLGVGAYRTEEGKPLVLPVVRKAEQAILADPTTNHEYLGIAGMPEFITLSRALAFGGQSSAAVRENRIATVQALSGTGSLRIGMEFLAQHYRGPKEVLLPRPTWGNHKSIAERAGLQVREYRYFAPATRGLDYEGLIADLMAAEPGSIVVLHACAHNPTGVDPTQQQWQGILQAVQARKLMPFFDMAYQGFASGDLDVDASALRLFSATPGMELLLAQSYAKNMGLYGQRVGALSVQCSTHSVVGRVESQLKIIIRANYSNPPAHGARIAARVLADPTLLAEWKVQLRGMAERIHAMRAALYEALMQRNVRGDWSFVKSQIGMFSYTGMSRAQCEHLTRKWHVYLTMDGRISMAGLSAARAGYLADAIKDALEACP